MQTVSQFIDANRYDLFNLDILIIGVPASGKTTVGKMLEREIRSVLVHTDDYLEFGNVDSLYVCLDDLELKIPPPRIIEGVGGYRLLRKGVQLDCYYPNLVIELTVDPAQVERTYRTQRQYKSLPHLGGFNKACQSILTQYRAMPNPHPPKWVTLYNPY